MRVLFQLREKVETIENVSVDDKCFPVVEGKHPYPMSESQFSPLARESALWYKTLAVDAIFIDCDRRLIFWTPVTNDVDAEVVSLRRSNPPEPSPEYFVPRNAKPLFEDSGHYEFDASLREMMTKCSSIVRKYMKHALTVEEFHRNVANILHVYILKSIVFSRDDLYCLSRAMCLIEERLKKSERNIIEVADQIDKLDKCLISLQDTLLMKENLDSERYLRTCKRDFLKVFLRRIEMELEKHNLMLEAEQSKVNWAKSTTEDEGKLLELKEKRDSIFLAIDKYIRVREGIKNVIFRKEKTKKKIRNPQVIESCFHNIFVEVDRRLGISIQSLDRLCNDKVNISGAREATIATIVELKNNNPEYERDTRFEPEDFLDFNVDEGAAVEKPNNWLTFQERVSRVIENQSSEPYRIHKQGCRSLSSQINLVLSEYNLAISGGCAIKRRRAQASYDVSRSFSLGDVTVTIPKHPDGFVQVRRNVHGKSCVAELPGQQDDCIFDTPNTEEVAVDDISLRVKSDHFADSVKARKWSSDHSTNQLPDEVTSQNDKSDNDDYDSPGGVVSENHMNLTHQLALNALMKQVENLKSLLHALFRDVVESLVQHLDQESLVETSVQEQTELLWRSYERSFCQEMLPQLTHLYKTGLRAGIKSAYKALSNTPLRELLKGDKILELFFGQRDDSSSSLPISFLQSADKISIAKTLSSLSLDVRHCDINDLYKLANDDSRELVKRFSLDDPEEGDEDNIPDSSSTGSSDHSHEVGSFPSSCEEIQGAGSGGTLSSEDMDSNPSTSPDKWHYLQDPSKIEEVLDPVLTPFRRQIRKCLDAQCFLDKVRYITKAIEDLNRDISRLYGPDHQSACDDIISMLILALSNLSKDIFIGLYIDLRLLMDILPPFLSGTLWDYNLVSLCASYDYLFSRNVCEKAIKRYPGSFKVRVGR